MKLRRKDSLSKLGSVNRNRASHVIRQSLGVSVKGTEEDPLSGSSYEELKTHVEYDGADLAASADLKVRAWIETSSLDEHPWKVTANGDDTVAVAAGGASRRRNKDTAWDSPMSRSTSRGAAT